MTMGKYAIRVQDLGKQYRIGAQVDRYRTFRDVLVDTASRPVRWLRRQLPLSMDVIWALREVSFDVHRGQVLGVIGRNGAGKSTLLKILSRVTEPTQGQVEINGQGGVPLGGGAGFYPG